MHHSLSNFSPNNRPCPNFTGMFWLQLISRICHILGAIILVGGLFYIRYVISPVDTPPGTAPVDQFFGGRRAAWAKWVGIATALLLVTGLFNYIMVIKQNERPRAVLSHGRRHQNARRHRRLPARRTSRRPHLRRRLASPKMAFWLSTTLASGIITVALGSFLRTYPRTPKPDTTAPQLIAPANSIPQ